MTPAALSLCMLVLPEERRPAGPGTSLRVSQALAEVRSGLEGVPCCAPRRRSPE